MFILRKMNHILFLWLGLPRRENLSHIYRKNNKISFNIYTDNDLEIIAHFTCKTCAYGNMSIHVN